MGMSSPSSRASRHTQRPPWREGLHLSDAHYVRIALHPRVLITADRREGNERQRGACGSGAEHAASTRRVVCDAVGESDGCGGIRGGSDLGAVESRLLRSPTLTGVSRVNHCSGLAVSQCMPQETCDMCSVQTELVDLVKWIEHRTLSKLLGALFLSGDCELELEFSVTRR